MMSNKTERLLFQALGLLLLAYAAMRAWALPITHDEGSTLINHVPRGVVDMIFYIKDSTPNNHVLNTLLIKIFSGILGMDHFTARIPALIGGALYLWAASGIAQRISTAAPVRWFTFVILSCNPYLLEFFGLARGYALSVGLMLFAIERTLHWFDTRDKEALVWASVLALLSVEANFTLLNLYLPWFLLVCVMIYYEWDDWKARLETAKPMLIGAAALLVLCYKPMTSMASDGQLNFWGKNGFFQETVVDLMRCSTDNHPILGDDTKTKLANLAVLFSLGAWFFFGSKMRDKIRRFYQTPTAFFTLLFVSTLTVNVLLFFVFNIPFVNGRTALFFFMLFALQLASAGAWLWDRYGKYAYIYLAVLGLFAINNTVRSLSLSKNIEWWFDTKTFQVVDYLKDLQKKEGKTEPYTLDASWVLLNSFLYHKDANTRNMNRAVNFASWHDRRRPTGESEFFLAMEHDDKIFLRDSLKYQKVTDIDLGNIHELYRKGSSQ